MKLIEDMTIEEIAIRIENLSRQRVSQIFNKYSTKGDLETLRKINEAKKIVKKWKLDNKYGCDYNIRKKVYALWNGILSRCGTSNAYKDCKVCFTDFNHFFFWAKTQVGFMSKDFELDKDILVQGNRNYGPETCCFVPREINAILIGCNRRYANSKYPLGVQYNKSSNSFVAQIRMDGAVTYLGSFDTQEEAFYVYKTAKERQIKALAEKWKDKIDQKVYTALLNYQVDVGTINLISEKSENNQISP